MCRVIAIVNQKGGVGKTTTAMNLGCGLADRGNKVLMIDLDSQGSLSVCFGIENPDTLPLSISNMLLGIIGKGEKCRSHEVIRKFGSVDLIPGNCQLSAIEIMLNAEQFGRESVLRRLLAEVGDGYDYIIIDCSPTLNILSVNALVAANEVIVPFEPKKLSRQSIHQLVNNINAVREVGYNRDLKVVGFLATRVPKNAKVCRQHIEEVNREYKVFKAEIPMNQNIEKATMEHQPIIQYRPSDSSAKSYNAFIEEYLKGV